MTELTVEQQARRAWISDLAKARAEHLAELLPDLPEHAVLRGPEQGMMMVRGRTGGTGAPFNLGEVTVVRASVRLEATGAVGHAMIRGRDRDHALRAAILDALMQGPEAARLEAGVLAPLRADAERRRAGRAAKAAATRVEFFTMVRGEG